MKHPMDEIEDKQAIISMGKAAYYVYQGVREEGASRLEALLIVQAWVAGIASGKPEDEDDST
jgi:hypothetical protein